MTQRPTFGLPAVERLRRPSAADRLRLLVSVRDEAEAAVALAAGVDVIDVKEPRRGPLGRADRATLHRVAALVGTTTALSFAAGEALEEGDDEVVSAMDPIPAGYAFFKHGPGGLRDRPDRARVLATRWSRGPIGALPVAVAYVDCLAAAAPDPEEVVALAVERGCAGVLFDTFGKAPGLGLTALPDTRLADCVATARAGGLVVALAGSLEIEHVARVRELDADVMAVRGAVCANGREGRVDRGRLDALVAAIQRDDDVREETDARGGRARDAGSDAPASCDRSPLRQEFA